MLGPVRLALFAFFWILIGLLAKSPALVAVGFVLAARDAERYFDARGEPRNAARAELGFFLACGAAVFLTGASGALDDSQDSVGVVFDTLMVLAGASIALLAVLSYRRTIQQLA